MIARRRWHFHGRALKSRQPNLTSETSRSYDKRPRLEVLAPRAHIRRMRITDVTCNKCGAGYKRAESISPHGPHRKEEFQCVCGHIIETWDSPNLIGYRLTIQPTLTFDK
jgi:hypothetical protein